MCNGGVFEKDNSDDDKEDEDKKEDAEADQPWLVHPPLLLALTHLNLRIAKASPASPTLL